VLQLENQTPFTAAFAVLPDATGIDTLYVVVKATVTPYPFERAPDALRDLADGRVNGAAVLEL